MFPMVLTRPAQEADGDCAGAQENNRTWFRDRRDRGISNSVAELKRIRRIHARCKREYRIDECRAVGSEVATADFQIDGHRHPVDVIRGHRYEHRVAEVLREIVVLDAGVECVAEDGSEADVFDAPVGLCESGGAPIQSYMSKHGTRHVNQDRNGSGGTKDLQFVGESGRCTAKLKGGCANLARQQWSRYT
jgi:hypothetical protein